MIDFLMGNILLLDYEVMLCDATLIKLVTLVLTVKYRLKEGRVTYLVRKKWWNLAISVYGRILRLSACLLSHILMSSVCIRVKKGEIALVLSILGTHRSTTWQADNSIKLLKVNAYIVWQLTASSFSVMPPTTDKGIFFILVMFL